MSRRPFFYRALVVQKALSEGRDLTQEEIDEIRDKLCPICKLGGCIQNLVCINCGYTDSECKFETVNGVSWYCPKCGEFTF